MGQLLPSWHPLHVLDNTLTEIHKYTYTQIHKYINTQAHKYTDKTKRYRDNLGTTTETNKQMDKYEFTQYRHIRANILFRYSYFESTSFQWKYTRKCLKKK